MGLLTGDLAERCWFDAEILCTFRYFSIDNDEKCESIANVLTTLVSRMHPPANMISRA